METDAPPDIPSATAASFDAAGIHEALNQAESLYHTIFDGHVPDEVHRFDAFLATLRMVTDQSADTASKEQQR